MRRRNRIQNYHKHHYWLDALVVLVLLTVGGTCWYYHDANQRTPQTTWQRGKDYKMRTNNASNSSNPSNAKSNNSSNKVNQTKPQIAQPKPINHKGDTLGVFPQAMQGTWYSLDKYSDGGGKKVSKVVITPTTISYAHVPVTQLHARPLTAKPAKMSNTTQNWVTAVSIKGLGKDKGIRTINVRGWSQSAGDGDDYKVLHDNGMDILSLGGGAAGLTEANYFRTVSQAQNHLDQQFKGEHFDRQNY